MRRIEFPLSIGLVGAPGSGKAATAEEFVKIATPLFKENDSELEIVENAGNVLEREYTKAFGLFADPSDTIWAFFDRHAREMKLRLANKSFVAVGTTIDHMAHAGIAVENLMVGLQTEQQQVRLQRAQVALTDLTFLHLENRRYNFVFYLPHPGSTLIVPGGDDLEANYNSRVDRNLHSIFANFGMRLQIVEGTPEEKAQAMFETVKTIVEEGIPEPGDEERTQDGDLPSGDESTVTA